MKDNVIWVILIIVLIAASFLNTPGITGGAVDIDVLKFYGKQGINPYDTFMVDERTITLEKIFSDGSISVSVDGVLVFLRLFGSSDIDCLRIIHNGVFFDRSNPALSKVLLDVSKIC